MSEEAQDVGERRRRREAERSAQAHGSDRPLTRRELRAREQAVETGALALDDTGEFRVVREPVAPSGEEPPAITGSLGMTRRELRELRARQEAAAAQSAPSGGAAPSSPSPPEPSTSSGTDASLSAPPSPTPDRGTPAVQPPVRRPVVRPPATASGVRSLAPDGTGLTPVVRGPHRDDAGGASADAAGWGAESATIDATEASAAVVVPPPAAAEPVAPAVPDPGPLPTTRRTRREPGEVVTGAGAGATPSAAARTSSAAAAPEPSLDAVIAGETEEPEPFNARPAWAELPPPTPAGGVLPTATAVAAGSTAAPAAPRDQATEVMPPASGPAPQRRSDPPPSDVDDNDDDEDGEGDDEGTPRWLTALMIVVLIVIGVVLGLLVYQLFLGDGATGAGPGALLGERWYGMSGIEIR